jgi:DNA modification methylase
VNTMADDDSTAKTAVPAPTGTPVKVARAKGRPMLTWVGKKPLDRVRAYPAQPVEEFAAPAAPPLTAPQGWDWSDWPSAYGQGGLLFHGDNKDVLAHLIANGFRGKVKLVYIDPPFDSGADYVRKVQLRGPKGTLKIDGEDYALGEQVQYTDIWSNDNYLQFMYERLTLLRELLHESGTIYLHCDPNKGHLLRCLTDEVFGPECFRNEVIWHYENKLGTGARTFDGFHDSLLVYTKSKRWTHNPLMVDVKEVKMQPVTQKIDGKRVWLRNEDGKRIYKKSSPQRGLGDVWTIPIINPVATERECYPTKKPEQLLENVIQASSDPSDIVLDCFIGSGTTAAFAQKLGRRWIGCDINKGAIQTTAKRLQGVIAEQAAALAARPQAELLDEKKVAPPPCQLRFGTWCVNDYDLQIQHNEALELVAQHLGITRTRTDPVFDGLLGAQLVKLVPLNHPLSLGDCEALATELKSRPQEERDVVLVCLGAERQALAWIDRHNAALPVNRIHRVDLRTDRRAGGVIRHEPMTARITVERTVDDRIAVKIHKLVSPTILQRLDAQDGIVRAEVADWRSMVDCVLIDTAHDGKVFNVTLADVPERKQDFVAGRWELPAPPPGSIVAVKVIDMLGEELIATFPT